VDPRKLLVNIGTLVLVVLLIMGYLWFAPKPLGGPVSYVVTDGTSMEPRLKEHDLVIVRESSSYEIGDVAAYKSESLKRVVLHRIVDIDESGFVFKGDNNDFLDQDRPNASQILGKKWLVVKGGGKVLAWIGNPVAATIIAFLVAFVLFIGFRSRSGKGGTRGEGSRTAPTARPPRGSEKGLFAVIPLTTACMVFVVCGAVAFAQPLSREEQRAIRYDSLGRFEYESETAKTDVYPSGSVETGQPLFLRLVDKINVRFEYQLDSEGNLQIQGSSSMAAKLSSATGWTHSFEVQPESDFDGNAETVSGSVDLQGLKKLVARFQRLTGVQEPLYTLEITPQVRVTGDVAGEPIEETFAPELKFEFDALKVKLAILETPTTVEATTPNQLRPTARGTVYPFVTVPNAVSVGPLSINVGTLRIVSLVGVAAFGLLALVFFFAKSRIVDEPADIARRYGRWMITVESLRPTSARTVVEVHDIDELVQLAERYDRLILHQEEDGIHSYVVEEGNVAYWYQVVPGSREASNVTSLPTRPPSTAVDLMHERLIGSTSKDG
jgi:signal peptidase I